LKKGFGTKKRQYRALIKKPSKEISIMKKTMLFMYCVSMQILFCMEESKNAAYIRVAQTTGISPFNGLSDSCVITADSTDDLLLQHPPQDSAVILRPFININISGIATSCTVEAIVKEVALILPCNHDPEKYKTLRLEACKYTQKLPKPLPYSVSAFKNIKMLIVRNMGIDSLENVAMLKQLAVIDFSNNLVSNITPLCELRNLRCIYGKNNKIAIIPSTIEKLVLLEMLDLENNNIVDISPIAEMMSQMKLALNGNPISGQSVEQIIPNINRQISILGKIVSKSRSNSVRECLTKIGFNVALLTKASGRRDILYQFLQQLNFN
jgi:hypothetical protein